MSLLRNSFQFHSEGYTCLSPTLPIIKTMLKVQFKDKRSDPFWLMEKTFSIGQASDNHLVIDAPLIAPHHAKVLNQGDSFLLKDLGGEGGTYVNGQRINQKNIACGDTISFGDVQLEIIDPLVEASSSDFDTSYWSLIADSSWLSGQEFPLVSHENGPLTLGRGTQCDIVFAGTHLSRQHAQILINDGSITLRDLNSANGTYVNDKKVDEAEVYPGDRVRLDVYSFRVFGPGIDLPKSSTSIQRALQIDEQEDEPKGSKKWKTKPTSPGNREEPTYGKRNKAVELLLAGTIFVALAGVVYMLFGG